MNFNWNTLWTDSTVFPFEKCAIKFYLVNDSLKIDHNSSISILNKKNQIKNAKQTSIFKTESSAI